ncbi:MAG: glycosyltransferase [Planctomycetota bacterium]
MLQPVTHTFTPPAAVVVPPQPVTIDARVLHVINGEHFAGAERVQSHLGRCLPQFGVQADFACLKRGKFSELAEQADERWGVVHETAMSHRADLRPAKQICDLIRQHHYQLLHAHTPRAAMISAAASVLSGVPWIYHVHSPASRDSKRKWANHINAWIEKGSLHTAAHLITVSESLRLDCEARGVSEDRITVVHNGVPASDSLRECERASNSRWTLGMVALMRPRKGLEILLDAIAQLTSEGHDINLQCIGPFESEDYRKTIQQQIDRLRIGDRVHWTGFTEDVPSALVQLDALVLPSLFGEGLPMVVLEAMAAAIPVVATRVEGTPEAITHGVEGLLAEPGNADDLANQIADLMSGQHCWRAMSNAALERHRTSFSDLAMSGGVAGVYQQVIPSAR